MPRTGAAPRLVVAAVILAVSLAGTLTACGDEEQPSARSTAAETVAARTDGDWLLRFVTAEGEDGEAEGAVYVSYNPATGEARTRTIPAVRAVDVSQDQQALLVNADHTLALQDTGVPEADQQAGTVTTYRLDTDTTETVDVRALTGRPDLRPVAGAFDPQDAAVLRVVDADLEVWRLDLDADTATSEGRLPRREGWIFGNGFDRNTGEPYVESIDSDETEPAGNGDSDARPVERQGGRLFRYDGDALAGLPEPPCGFAGGFRYDDGDTWLFCADTPSIAAYRLGGGAEPVWEPVGTPSDKIVPAVAADLGFVLPPVG